MLIYLSVTPGEEREAVRYSCMPAHVAYRIGPDSTLLRQNLPAQLRGGLLSLSDWDAPEILSPEKLSGAIWQECSRRSYTGVVLDFEAPIQQDRLALLGALSRSPIRGRRALFAPEDCARDVPAVTPLVNTALSGGNYVQYLREKIAAWNRLPALDLQRLAMEFSLPQPSGQGVPLTQEALSERIRKFTPSVFFSQDLCARYFTYTLEGRTRFVLYDDAGTLRQKLHLGTALGLQASFLMYPEVSDLLGQLFSTGRETNG